MKRQYKKTSYNKNSEAKQTGVMYSWFNSSDSKMYELNLDRNTIENNSFLSTKSYLCTLAVTRLFCIFGLPRSRDNI